MWGLSSLKQLWRLVELKVKKYCYLLVASIAVLNQSQWVVKCIYRCTSESFGTLKDVTICCPVCELDVALSKWRWKITFIRAGASGCLTFNALGINVLRKDVPLSMKTKYKMAIVISRGTVNHFQPLGLHDITKVVELYCRKRRLPFII